VNRFDVGGIALDRLPIKPLRFPQRAGAMHGLRLQMQRGRCAGCERAVTVLEAFAAAAMAWVVAVHRAVDCVEPKGVFDSIAIRNRYLRRSDE
jgi:hypothetical protein